MAQRTAGSSTTSGTSSFLALQLLRGRSFRAFMDEAADRQLAIRVKPSPGSTLTAEEFELVDRQAADAVATATRTKQVKIRAMLAETGIVAPFLLEREWTLLSGHDFITGDVPFVPADFRGNLGFGLGVAVADFFLAPVSPTRLLFLGSPGLLPPGRLAMPEAAQREVRLAVWRAADRETYRHPASPHP